MKHLCDGCKVREPFEHRCHGSDGAWRGDPPCECGECRDEREFIERWRDDEKRVGEPK